MSDYAELLLERFRAKGVLVDSNLLLLLLVGGYDPELIGPDGFKRLVDYTAEDYALLVFLLQQFSTIVTTPQILTEVSNLAGQLPDRQKQECLEGFVNVFVRFAELQPDSFASAEKSAFPRIGLTDAVISDLADQYLVITSDARLCATLNGMGLEPLNFNHIRPLAWQLSQ